MINCRLQIEDYAECVQCCVFCDKKDTCKDVCQDMTEACEEQVMVLKNELEVIQEAEPEALRMVTDIAVQMEKLEERQKLMKQKLLEAMENYGIKKFENDKVIFTYVAPTTRTSVDSAKLKKVYPNVYEDCCKTSNVSASVRIKVKK